MKTEMTHEAWAHAMSKCKSSADRAKLNGPSPAAAAHRLGISHSTVRSQLKRGYLDAIVLLHQDGAPSGVIVTEASLDEYEARSQRRAQARELRSA